jgi:hypothetical protein
MCPFCLLYWVDDVCYFRDTDRKPICSETECNKGHIKWLHNIMKVKSMSVIEAMNAKEKEETGHRVQ